MHRPNCLYVSRQKVLLPERSTYFHLFPPQLFDLRDDPGELRDLGRDARYRKVRARLRKRLHEWRRRLKPRVGMPFDNLDGMGPARDEALGIVIGRW